MNSKRVSFAVLAAALVAIPGRADAQAADSAIVYEREVFEYSRGGRADPFRSLLDDAELGVRLEDLTLRGVMVGSEPGQSVAVLSRAGSTKPLRVQVGDRIGGIRILSIGPQSVDVLVEEFGVARRGTLELKSVTQKGTS